MADKIGKNGRAHVFEISNRAAIQEINTTDLTTIRADLSSHTASGNTNAHQISNINGLLTALNGKAPSIHTHSISDVTGLDAALNSKQDIITGFTGSITVITSVDFVGSSTTSSTINVTNGIITSVV